MLWTRRLPGSWAAQNGALGTVPSQGQADAAVGNGLVVVGFGGTVLAYRLSDGQPLWTADLAGFPVGSAIVSVRAWPGVVTAGVSLPGGSGSGGRDEVVLSAATGQPHPGVPRRRLRRRGLGQRGPHRDHRHPLGDQLCE